MQTPITRTARLTTLACAAAATLAEGAWAQTVSTILDASGDGSGNALASPVGVAVDSLGNVFVAGYDSDNLFRVAPDGTVTEILDASGDGSAALDGAHAVAVDVAGNVYVTGSSTTNNVFRVAPDGSVTEVLAAGSVTTPLGIAVDAAGNLYVSGSYDANLVRVAPDGTVTELIDGTGDGTGNQLLGAAAVALDGAGNVYVVGTSSNNVFRIAPDGAITQIVDSSGAGPGKSLNRPLGLAVDAAGNVFVSGFFSDNVLRVTPDGAITEVLGVLGQPTLDEPRGLAFDAAGNLWVTRDGGFDGVFKLSPGGVITTIDLGIHASGVRALATGPAGDVYVTGHDNSKVARVASPAPPAVYCDTNPDNASDISISSCTCAAGSIDVTLSNASPFDGNVAVLLVSRTNQTTNPANAIGDLCVVGSCIGRFSKDAAFIQGGTCGVDVLNALSGGGGGDVPSCGGNLCDPAYQTYYFQFWHRDGMNPSRFSKALEMTFD